MAKKIRVSSLKVKAEKRLEATKLIVPEPPRERKNEFYREDRDDDNFESFCLRVAPNSMWVLREDGRKTAKKFIKKAYSIEGVILTEKQLEHLMHFAEEVILRQACCIIGHFNNVPMHLAYPSFCKEYAIPELQSELVLIRTSGGKISVRYAGAGSKNEPYPCRKISDLDPESH